MSTAKWQPAERPPPGGARAQSDRQDIVSPSLIPPSADHRCCVRDPRTSGVPDLTIIVPAYNERSRLPATLRELSGYFPEPVEILVVDDGSDDGTWEIASKALEGTRHAFAVLRQEANQGKGRAVRSGMLRARGRRWLVIDADGATPIAEWEKLRERLDAGADIAIGSRAMPGSRIRTRQPWHRRLLGPCFNLLVRAILFRGIRDTQCGFKAYQPEVARVLCRLQRIDGFSFDPETLFLALRSGCRVEEVGVAWNDRAGSKVRVLSDALRMLRDLLRVRFYAASGLYDRDPAGVRRSALPLPVRQADELRELR